MTRGDSGQSQVDGEPGEYRSRPKRPRIELGVAVVLLAPVATAIGNHWGNLDSFFARANSVWIPSATGVGLTALGLFFAETTASYVRRKRISQPLTDLATRVWQSAMIDRQITGPSPRKGIGR